MFIRFGTILLVFDYESKPGFTKFAIRLVFGIKRAELQLDSDVDR